MNSAANTKDVIKDRPNPFTKAVCIVVMKNTLSVIMKDNHLKD
jgi:hypothetical protein